jgi:hypothetical protein
MNGYDLETRSWIGTHQVLAGDHARAAFATTVDTGSIASRRAHRSDVRLVSIVAWLSVALP